MFVEGQSEYCGEYRDNSTVWTQSRCALVCKDSVQNADVLEDVVGIWSKYSEKEYFQSTGGPMCAED